MELLSILTVVEITQLHVFVETHRIIHYIEWILQYVNYASVNLPLKKKINAQVILLISAKIPPVGGWFVAPIGIQVLKEPVDVTWYVKRDFADVIKTRNLR